MFPLAPLAIIGQALASPVVSGLASAAAAGALRAVGNAGEANNQASNSANTFSDLINSVDTHGNGWLTRADTLGRAMIAGGRLLSAEPDPAQEAATRQDRGNAACSCTPPAQMLLASETAAGGPGVVASQPHMPMVDEIRATYAALRAAR